MLSVILLSHGLDYTFLFNVIGTWLIESLIASFFVYCETVTLSINNLYGI